MAQEPADMQGVGNAVQRRGCPRNCNRRARIRIATDPKRIGKADESENPGARKPASHGRPVFGRGAPKITGWTVAATRMESSRGVR